ncbi:AAA family ATPase [Streptomyces antibioticus]|uniref:AAA family ATPase n=1 Tax=Streptomyces antibioticus TaxID=1890 RepID=UPI00368EB4CB
MTTHTAAGFCTHLSADGRVCEAVEVRHVDGKLGHVFIPAPAGEGPPLWPEDQEPEQAPGRRIELTPASKIRIRPVRWLWDTTPEKATPTSHGRIPMYSMAIAAGGPGLGKSQFAVWLTAQITRGQLPGELYGRPRGVIYAATEDSWSYTIAPRLIAAGANLDLVFRVDVRSDEALHARLTLPTDISLLGQAAEAYSIALVVADPLLSLIDKSVNDYRAAEVREALEPLVAAADRHHFTILGLAHFTKAGGSDPVARISGSGAFGQLIRSLIAFAEREHENGDTDLVLSVEKNNLGRLGLPAFKYAIQPCTVETPEGPSYVSRFVLGGASDMSVRDVMRAESGFGGGSDKEVDAWLKGYLTDCGGSATRPSVMAAGRKAGYSESTLNRAKKALKLEAGSTGFGKDKVAVWSLPGVLPADGPPSPPESPSGAFDEPPPGFLSED